MPTAPIDPTDRDLLAALRADGRAPYAELGRRVGLSAPAVHDRVAKLEASGAITGYHAAVAPAAIGLAVLALVGVFTAETADQDEVADRLRDVSAIEDCWLVAGEETFVVTVRAVDVDGLEHVLGALRRIRGVARTRTTIVLSTRWEDRVQVDASGEPGREAAATVDWDAGRRAPPVGDGRPARGTRRASRSTGT